jgi:hypothetical protein
VVEAGRFVGEFCNPEIELVAVRRRDVLNVLQGKQRDLFGEIHGVDSISLITSRSSRVFFGWGDMRRSI